MGTPRWLSTLGCELNGYASRFSGKLSPVMPNSEDHTQQPRRQQTGLPERAIADGTVAHSMADGTVAHSMADEPVIAAAALPREVGGGAGPEPTRFGDWELRGRCIDF
jgi:hypothetical protein